MSSLKARLMPKTLRDRLILWIVSFSLLLIIVLIGILYIIALQEPSYKEWYIPTSDNVVLVQEGGNYSVLINGEKPELELKSSNSLWEQYRLVVFCSPLFILIPYLILRLLNKYPMPVPLPRWGETLYPDRYRKPIGVISLKSAPSGLIAVRAWNYDKKKGLLVSLNKNILWGSRIMRADKPPALDQFHGVYGCRLGMGDVGRVKVCGVVSLSGRLVFHADGVVRGSRCEILAIVIEDESIADILRGRYQCPVVVSRSPEITIEQWQVSPEGIFWLRHNYDLVQQGIARRVESDINEIVKHNFREAI